MPTIIISNFVEMVTKDQKTMLIVGGLALAGVAYLVYRNYSKDSEESVTLSKEEKMRADHEIIKLIRILNAGENEYKSVFASWYKLGKKMGEMWNKQDEKNFERTMEARLYQYLQDIDLENAKRLYSMDIATYKDLFKKFRDDPRIQTIIRPIEENLKRVARCEKPMLDIHYPDSIDLDKYLSFLELAFKDFRYKVYKDVQEEVQKPGKKIISDEDFKTIIHNNSLHKIKVDVWNRLDMPSGPRGDSYTIINNVLCDIYLNHPELAAKVDKIQKEHKEILLHEIAKGKEVEGLDQDPVDAYLVSNGKLA